MKNFIGLGICAALLVSCGDDKKEQSAEDQVTEAPAMDMANPEVKLNYAIGMGAGLTFVEYAGLLKLTEDQLNPDEALKGFKEHLSGTSSMTAEKSQEVLGMIYKKREANQELTEEEINQLCYAEGVIIAEGAKRKMTDLNVADKMQKDVIITGAEHQFKKQPTAISKEDMEALLANLEKDRNQNTPPPQAQAAPLKLVDGIDAYSGDKKTSYALGLNNGWQLSQNISNLAPAFAAKIDIESLISGVEQNLNKDVGIDNTEFQTNMQEFFKYEQNPGDMPEEVANNFTNSLAVTMVQGVEQQKKVVGDLSLDKASFIDGLSGVLLRNEGKMSVQDLDQYITGLSAKKGEAFLAANKNKPGVKVTASGLQYKVLKSGSGGAKPTPNDKVRVHYHGTLIDGTVFDSSVDRGEPAEFGVTQVIKGWIEGLQLMSVGDKFEFYVPQELAYGANPRPGGPIKPYDALIFQVELLEIK